MEKMNKDLFGKFQNSKIEMLASVKGGSVIGTTSTTLCKTAEGSFDTDEGNTEHFDDKRCILQN
jgi:hypothetical protein